MLVLGCCCHLGLCLGVVGNDIMMYSGVNSLTAFELDDDFNFSHIEDNYLCDADADWFKFTLLDVLYIVEQYIKDRMLNAD